MLKLLLGVVAFAFWLYCLIDVIVTPSDRTRFLPKAAWVLLVLFFPFVGSIVWLVVGRPQKARTSRHERPQPTFPEYDRPGRAAAIDPVKDEEFLRRVRERAEEQRRRHEQSRRPKEPEAEAPSEQEKEDPQAT